MAEVDHIWAGWRSAYVSQSAKELRDARAGLDNPECILCALSDKGKDHYVVARNNVCFTVMNLYPYTNGHMMVVPLNHHQQLDDYDGETRLALMEMTTTATRTLRNAYSPDGMNVGLNIGEAAGAGVPGHLHMHVLPRWVADAGFVTSAANARTLPETLDMSYEKIWNLWPEGERI